MAGDLIQPSIDHAEYEQWLAQLCEQIDRQRLKAAMQLNAATLQHYWWFGNDILQKQEKNGWGAKIIDMLSRDLLRQYGTDSGYSVRNLKYMRQFAAEYNDFPFVQVPLAQITWYFADTLPPVHSDLAKATFKDPYNLGFLDMTKIKQETDLEDQLTSKITDFLLELGKGFAYIGRQYPLNIAGELSRVDLLMYHTQLHCYVAIELKATEFKPEYLSKLNYYISAIDDLVKTSNDNPTIGLLLCRTKNNTKVEYALRGMSQPLGVAEFKTKEIFESLKSSLPSIDDLERTLNDV